ncbi:hypothetical protein TVAG_311820 [Trichomonas vaginalis G3]|uniref:EamA domain-containing protein n=1 Tax=Trichomonas vaginalis (strain ATCC PRA-98 / G3) TaxID=412133 RepID=A2EJY8_TRIV3|nr:hypothetical protein TVAGG3_0324710 [Trichomonas vaginalis G3]EAY07056.1 hypothetical protein TVAG_311820 [Trichomonas vaginalis G3]KAI5529549.1 hypothetical protein TVAGG3_0324710 [Trichomonas vaginalis G3]|eukprot:XP_001319279.1 hypothetical protein [Trichomonas vaginalis G3]
MLIFLFTTLAKGIDTPLSSFRFQDFTALGYSLMQIIFAAAISFIATLVIFFVNEKAFTSFLGSKSLFISELHYLILNSLATVALPIILINYSVGHIAPAVVSLSFPLIPLFTNLANMFSIYKEVVPRRKLLSMAFSAAGFITSLSLYSIKAFKDHELIQLLTAVIALLVAHIVYAFGERFTSELIIHLDPYVVPLSKYLISAVFIVILLLIFDPLQFRIMDESFSNKSGNFIIPAMTGIFSKAFSYYLSYFIINPFGFSIYSIVFYPISLISLAFNGLFSGKLFNDLPITLSFLIAEEMHIIALILDFISPIVTTRKDERNRLNIKSRGENTTPYSTINQIDNDEKLTLEEDAI